MRGVEWISEWVEKMTGRAPSEQDIADGESIDLIPAIALPKLAQCLACPEAYAFSGGTDDAWLAKLFQVIEGANASQWTYWQQLLAANVANVDLPDAYAKRYNFVQEFLATFPQRMPQSEGG